jgi:hypothetical protein
MEEQIIHIRERLLAARARQRFWGIVLSILGFVTLVDSGAPFPIPLVGLPSILVGLLCLGSGAGFLYRQQELPVSEALELAALQGGFLSEPMLVRALHVTPDTAERILRVMVERGYARLEDSALEDGAMTYRVLGLEAPPPSLPPGPAGSTSE